MFQNINTDLSAGWKLYKEVLSAAKEYIKGGRAVVEHAKKQCVEHDEENKSEKQKEREQAGA